MMKNVIGKKLREMGKTQGWLARTTGLSQSFISRVVRQKAQPRTWTAWAISKAMRLTIEDLFLFE